MVSDAPKAMHCEACGCRVDWRSGHCLNARCSTNQVDWDQPALAKPVRLPTREELLQDSRRALWHDVAVERIPMDRVVIIARSYDEGASWLISRLEPGVLPYIHGRAASHWAEDILGTPRL